MSEAAERTSAAATAARALLSAGSPVPWAARRCTLALPAMDDPDRAPAWKDWLANYWTMVELCTRLLDGERPLSDHQRANLLQLRATAYFRARALEQEPQELYMTEVMGGTESSAQHMPTSSDLNVVVRYCAGSPERMILVDVHRRPESGSPAACSLWPETR
jgi:hypothetical protein